MHPSKYYIIKDVPMTGSGKVDLNKIKSDLGAYVQLSLISNLPLSNEEKVVASIFAEVLDIDLDAEGDFFMLGGSSLELFRLKRLLDDKFSVDIDLSYVYQNPTVRKITAYVNELLEYNNKNLPLSNNAQTKNDRECSLEQHRFYIMQFHAPNDNY